MTVKTVRLKEVCDVIMGQAPKGDTYNSEGIGLPLLAGAGDLGEIEPIPSRFTTKPTRLAKPGDIILCVRATLGRTNWARRTYCLGRGVASLRANSQQLDSRYLWHWIATQGPNLEQQARGSTFRQVTRDTVERLRIPLPPLPEQRRIAAILDNADAVRRKRQQTLDLADQFLRSAFLDMFGDPVTNPKGWPIKKLSEAFVTDIVPTKCGPFGSALRKDEYTDSGVPVLTMNNIAGDSFCLDGCLHITQEKYQDLSTYAVREGDIIISRAGTVGKMCVVPPLDAPAIISTNLIRLSLDGRILEPAFFVALMTYCRGRVGKLRTGNDGSYTFMNTGVLRGLYLPFPSTSVQADWVQLLSGVRQHKSELLEHQATLQDLSDSLAQRAFRGELIASSEGQP